MALLAPQNEKEIYERMRLFEAVTNNALKAQAVLQDVESEES